jgi:hypothetical protein
VHTRVKVEGFGSVSHGCSHTHLDSGLPSTPLVIFIGVGRGRKMGCTDIVKGVLPPRLN